MLRSCRLWASLVAAGWWHATASAAEAPPQHPPVAPAPPAAPALHGGSEGTAFGNLTVEGEDRVHFEIARPALDLTLDPQQAPGLDWGSAHDVLDRTVPDPVAPFTGASTAALSPYLGRPWAKSFTCGEVARFAPEVDNVESWQLLVADSRGQVVRTFEGHGKPPREIAWDGRTKNGTPAVPGLTYSYVLEARDRAGNKRNFVGSGFQLPAYRLDAHDGPLFAFAAPAASGAESPMAAAGDPRNDLAPFLLEVASGLNQVPPSRPVRIVATARTDAQARGLADRVARALSPLVLGGSARVQVQTRLEQDAAVNGTLQIAPIP